MLGLAGGLGFLVLTADAATHHRHRHHHRKLHAQAYSRKQGHVRVIGVKFGGRGGGGDPGDDYPAVLKNQRQDAVLDQWREYNRECTSFAAWALASRNGFVMPFYANARDWGAKAIARGFTVDHTPAPGSIAWSTAGTFGHVAYVQDVVPGGVHIEEYNHDGRGHYSSRVLPASAFTGYIHFKDRPADAPVSAPAPPPQPQPGPAPTATATPAPVPTATPAPLPPSAPPTWGETTGGIAHTWTNYTNAGGTEGPSIGANQTVRISCRLQGFRVADGNTWWYRIASAPWSNQFYVSADAFYNNGQTSGSLHGTPFVDPAVAGC
jgi:surface antigen